jgi:nicotinamide mononucleotide transporter
MTQEIGEWLVGNKIEVLGAILGIAYIFFSIRQNILTWPTGLLTSVLYVFVFFQSKFYADMGLQVYYVFISIYGWYFWIKGKNTDSGEKVPVRVTPRKLLILLAFITLFLYLLLLFILIKMTDSDVPYMDSLTTALSITATWMLARKYIEHWLIWIFIDLVSSGLYIYKNLWPTVVLFGIYTVMAIFGYLKWKKDFYRQHIEKIS